MSIYIKNIDTYETITKFNTTKWRPIYEVIDESYIKYSKIFPDNFIRDFKNNSNEARDIPHDIKNNMRQMEMEKSLYTQVVKLCRKDLKFVVYLDLNWVEINFSTREPDFYKKLFKSHGDTQDNNTFKNFQVPIGNAKCVESFK